VRAVTDRFWDEAAERPDADSAAREDRLLIEQLAHVAETSPFYRRLWDAAGVSPRDVRGVADLPLLPFTEKDDLRRSQEAAPPLGGTAGATLESIVRIQCTGGTTGVPMRIGFAREDLSWLDEVAARGVWCAGGRPGDLLFECMNYSLYVGGVTDHLGFEHAGLCVLPYGVGQSTRLLELARAMATPWCLYSTPAYALRLAAVAREQGLEPRELGLAKGFFSGEAGLQVPGFRARIEDAWGCQAHDLYGLSETGVMAAECEHRIGLHLVCGGWYAVELIDPGSGRALALDDGAEGELVFTNLKRRVSYLVRFRSHDVVRIAGGPCACGRTGPRFTPLGRSDEMFIVRGVNVFPLAVGDVISALRPAVGGAFRIVLDAPAPIDYDPLLLVEQGELGAEDAAARVVEAVRARLGFSTRVEIVPPDRLAPAGGKTRLLERRYDEEAP
jgi:phenylacetate-CoA ligase